MPRRAAPSVVTGLLLLFAGGAFAAEPADTIASQLERAEAVRASDPDAARRLLDQAESALAKADLPSLAARAQLLECRWATAAEPALRSAAAVLAAASKLNDVSLRAGGLACRAEAFYASGREADAEKDFTEAARLAGVSGHEALRADALRNAGMIRYARGATADALTDLQEAYRLNVRLRREVQRLDTLTVIANIYAEPTVGEYDRAIEHYQAILREYERLGRPADVGDTLFNLGSTFQKKGEIAAALQHYRRAVTIFDQAGKPSDAAYTRRAIGTALVRADRPAEALPWFERALRVLVAEDEVDEAAATRQARGAAYRKLHRPAEAIRDLQAVLPYYEREKNNRFLERIYDDLAASYGELGRWQEASAAQARRVDVQRALFDAQRAEHAARLRVEFDTERREEENRALARENALRRAALENARRVSRLQMIVIALTVLLAAALAVLFWRQRVQARRMRVMALTDELTRLPNRRHVLAVAEESWQAAARTSEPLSVIAFDIDRFKRINDTFGHAAGDVVLRRVAHVCRTALRPGDVIGRTGGEEFLVVLRRTTRDEAVEVAERLRQAVEETGFDDVSPGLEVTISLGVSSRPGEPAGRFDDVARQADEHLYRAKEGGRNRVAA